MKNPNGRTIRMRIPNEIAGSYGPEPAVTGPNQLLRSSPGSYAIQVGHSDFSFRWYFPFRFSIQVFVSGRPSIQVCHSDAACNQIRILFFFLRPPPRTSWRGIGHYTMWLMAYGPRRFRAQEPRLTGRSAPPSHAWKRGHRRLGVHRREHSDDRVRTNLGRLLVDSLCNHRYAI